MKHRASRASRFLARIPSPLMGNPFELFVALLCVLSAVPSLAGQRTAGSLDALLPTWLVRVWAAELLVGGLLVAAGIIRRSHPLERGGLVQLGPAAIAYAVAITTAVGPRGLVSASTLVAFGLACLARASVLAAADRMRAELVDVARAMTLELEDDPT